MQVEGIALVNQSVKPVDNRVVALADSLDQDDTLGRVLVSGADLEVLCEAVIDPGEVDV